MIKTENLAIDDLLKEYNQKMEYKKLREYYRNNTYFDIIAKGRNETTHSAFLGWILGGQYLSAGNQENPLIGLLDAIIDRRDKHVKKTQTNETTEQATTETELPNEMMDNQATSHLAEQDGEKSNKSGKNDDKKKDIQVTPFAPGSIYAGGNETFEKIRTATLTRSLHLSNINVELEKNIENLAVDSKKNQVNQSKNKGRGKKGKRDSIDIFISCDVSGVDGIDKFEFLIENKIGSKEEGPKDKFSQNQYDQMFQTARYYWACSEDDSDVNKDVNNDTATNEDSRRVRFFVYLNAQTPEPDRCQSAQYVCINYQDIYDNILAFIVNNDRLTQRDRYIIEDYIRTLSLPTMTEDGCDEEDGNQSKETKNEERTILAISNKEREILTKYWNDNQELIMVTLQALDDDKSDDDNSQVLAKYICKDGMLYTRKDVIQEVFNSYKKAFHNTRTTFNDIFKDIIPSKQRVSKDIINTDDTVCNGPQTINPVYEYLRTPNTSLSKYTSGYREPHYNDNDNDKLISFWNVNKSMIMAAVRVMSEKQGLPDSVKSDIEKAYKGLAGRDWTRYDIKKDDKEGKGLLRLQVMAWYIKTLLWNGKQGPVPINKTNELLKGLHNDSKKVRDRIIDENTYNNTDDYQKQYYKKIEPENSVQPSYYYYKSGYDKAFENLKNDPGYGCITESKQDA